jgi:hypothetical protein
MKNTYKIILGLILVVAFQNQSISQATRTWVSGVGDDVNPCSRTAPCKTFAGAISKTAEKGEINVLDPGGFGAVTITKAITITSEGFEAGILVSGGNGITINTVDATDRVILRGLDFEGLGTGVNGIRIASAESVIIENCTINGFATAGINVDPATNPIKIIMKDSRISNCGTGINVAPTGAATADVNIIGVLIGMNTTGVNSVGTGATLRLSNSSIMNNTTGVSAGSGKVVSFGNNNIIGNTSTNATIVTSQL